VICYQETNGRVLIISWKVGSQRSVDLLKNLLPFAGKSL